MDTLKIQISQLQDKTDRLYELVEQMNNRVDILSNSQSSSVEAESYSLPNFASGVSFSDKKKSDYQLTHKDVLVDDNNSTNSTKSNSDLAPETQIRRLTAQLTAAYNRIAALEEQLLTYRIHS